MEYNSYILYTFPILRSKSKYIHHFDICQILKKNICLSSLNVASCLNADFIIRITSLGTLNYHIFHFYQLLQSKKDLFKEITGYSFKEGNCSCLWNVLMGGRGICICFRYNTNLCFHESVIACELVKCCFHKEHQWSQCFSSLGNFC